MIHDSPVLILTLSQDKTKYYAHLIDKEDTTYAYIPSKETEDISGSRNKVIKNIKLFLRHYIYCEKFEQNELNRTDEDYVTFGFLQNYTPLHSLKKFVATKIFSSLGLADFFKFIANLRDTSLTVVTNDLEIPWEWTYLAENEGMLAQFLCEKFALGKIFTETTDKHINLDDLSFFDQKRRVEAKGIICKISDAKAAIVYDNYQEDLKTAIEALSQDIQEILKESKKAPTDNAKTCALDYLRKCYSKLLTLVDKGTTTGVTITVNIDSISSQIESFQSSIGSQRKDHKVDYDPFPFKARICSRFLENVNNDITKLKYVLVNGGIAEKNIIEISGKGEYNQDVLKDFVKTHLPGLKLIHLTSFTHELDIDILQNKISSQKLFSIGENKPFLRELPLVFLNTYDFEQRDEYVKDFEALAKGFLKIGAGACVCTSMPIFDKSFSVMVETFYDKLLKGVKDHPITVGEALRQARQTLRQRAEKTEEQIDDVSWLFYCLLGDPSFTLFPTVMPPSKFAEYSGPAHVDDIIVDRLAPLPYSLLAQYLHDTLKGQIPLEFKDIEPPSWKIVEEITSKIFHKFFGLEGKAWGNKRLFKRYPDGYFILPTSKRPSEKHWRVLYDCKSSAKEFKKFQIDDYRQMEDYLRNPPRIRIDHQRDSHLVFFLVIGSKFKEYQMESIDDQINSALQLRAKFIDADNLKYLIDKLIDHGFTEIIAEEFDWVTLFKHREISKKTIDEVVQMYLEILLMGGGEK